MKKHISILTALILSISLLTAYSTAGNKPTVSLGLSYGFRTINNTDLKNVYGNGTNFYPTLTLNWKGLILGLGYEGGFKRNGTIGLYEEAASLSVSGPEFFLGYELNLGFVAPYLKAGYGLYSYSQKISSQYLNDYPVSGSQGGIMFGGGLKIFPTKMLFILVEARYSQVKVKPYDVEVDVGGMKINGGLGIKF
jgi:hypothetical protein